MTGQPATDAVAYHERQLSRMFVAARLGGVIHASAGLLMTWPHLRSPSTCAGILAAVVVQSAMVIVTVLRQGSLATRWLMVTDVGCAMAGLVAVTATLESTADANVSNVLYPYSVLVTMGAGMALRRLFRVLQVAAGAAGLYLAVSVAYFGFDPRMVPNTMSYLAWASVCWVSARWFRRISGDLESTRGQALIRERELAVAREREVTSRALHDRVLQTLEFLERGGHIHDERMRAVVRGDTAWLRALVDGTGTGADGALVPALARVVEEQAVAGLRVDLCAAQERQPVLTPSTVDAVGGAVREALTNVRKHAGVDHAVVRVSSSGGEVVVTVLDQGVGMDPATTRHGAGVPGSIVRRVAQAGGTAQLTSAPGEGTHVELRVPLVPAQAVPGAPA